MNMGVVYLIHEFNADNNRYKIGMTSGSVTNRIKKLQTGNSNEITLVDYYKTDYPFRLEKMLHNYYHKERVLNEWFELNDKQVLDFKNTCQKYNDIILFMKKENEFF